MANEDPQLASAASWCSTMRLSGVPDSERVHKLLDLALKTEQLKEPPQRRHVVQEELFADYSQCVSRSPWSRNVLRSLTTSTTLYSYALQRAISPSEHFALLGFPQLTAQVLASVTPSQLRDLSGEAMSPAVMGGLLAAVLVAFNPPGLKEIDSHS